MRYRPVIAMLASLGLGAGGVAASAASAAPVSVQAASPAAASAQSLGKTPASTAIEVDVGLQLSDPSGALALERAVSDPKSPSYRHFLTPAQWEKRFSPAKASVDAVTAWLSSQGLTVAGASPDRMTVSASGSAATIEKAFATGLGQYRKAGRSVRLASAPLKVPSSIASLITGVSGIDQNVATPDHLTGAAVPRAKKLKEIPQPEGFRNASPCSSYYAQQLDTIDPAFGGGFAEPLPYAVCGYTPPQFQSAYGLTPQIGAGTNGSGVTVAIVDAYVSPTLFSDAQHYSQLNQPTQVLGAGQFSESLAKSFNQEELCEAPEWSGEQTLDVEAVHATAPGAKLLYVGAKNCLNGLFKSVQQVVDGHMADIITDSWGDNGGDLLDSAGTRRSFDNILLMAIGTGIGVQFSAGDEGDEFANLGTTVADYPPSSPFATAVGGTSLQVNEAGARVGEVGWSTSKSVLCSQTLKEDEFPGCKKGTIGKWLPKAPGAFLYGGGGGTSFEYPEPSYQEGVVPQVLAERNSKITGILNRVEPDISMNADPTTGMLVGETQVFPDGTYYDQYRIGGTSLSSPLFAGVMADADQAAGGALGFVNPRLYELAAAGTPGAYYDVVPAAKQADVRADFLDGVDAAEGTITSARTLDYEGREEFCSGTENCTRQNVAISTAPGFDSMTGIGTPGTGLIAALAKP
jgi:subtilase family serine protease